MSLACATVVFAVTGGVRAAGVEGDWAGWLYTYDGGDMPLQLSFSRDDVGRLVGSLSAPAQRAFDLAVSDLEIDENAMRFVRVNSSGTRMEYKATIDGDSLAGEGFIDGKAVWSFEMLHADRPIEHIEPSRLEDVPGLYRTGDGRTIIISSWFWGELIYQDTAAGRHSTLFTSERDTLFAGPRLYTPSPADLDIHVRRSERGDVVGLDVREGDAAPIRATRQAIVAEPVTFTSDNAKLYGEVRRPPGPGPFPGIVVIGGSGWSGRGGLTAQADIFVAMGFATLVFDKRGHGESGGDRDVPFDQIARDLLAAHGVLARRPEVIDHEVGLYGVSRGGWHVPLAASMSSDVAFAVAFVAPAISPEAQERVRRLGVLREHGASVDDIELAAGYLDLQFEFAATGNGWDRYMASRATIVERGWLDVLDGPESPDESEWRWARLNMRYDPLVAIAKLECPVLILLGGADGNVVAEDNAPLWRHTLASAPTRDFLVHVVPNANHGLELVAEGDRAVPLHLQRGSAPGVWPLVEHWLGERVTLR